jgi:beta-galactosidase
MNRKFLFCASLALFGSLPAQAQRERLRFDTGWKFHMVGESVGEPPASPVAGTPVEKWRWKKAGDVAAETADVTRPDFDDSTWPSVQTAPYALGQENSFGWFRTVVPNAPTAPVIHFESVDDNATVYLNGQKLSEHSGWDDPFDVDLTPAWKPTGPNIVTVLVGNVGGSGGMGAAGYRRGEVVAIPPVTSGPAATNYNDKAWRSVQLPHDFVIEGSFDPKGDVSHGFLPKGAAWYRKTFGLPAADKGKTLWLEFDGVYRNSVAWLNGHELGKHRSGYTSFYYDIGKYANYNGNNTLVVFADARQNEGWWYEGGGIYRHVYLTTMTPVHFSHWGTFVNATPSADFASADVEVQSTIDQDAATTQTGDVAFTVLDPTGKSVATLSVGGAKFMHAHENSINPRLRIANPQLWSPDSPKLYTLVATIRQGRKVVDEERTTFGIRSMRWDANKGFFLNGKPFKIQGTCNHQDFAGIGVALPDRVHYYKVARLKEMGSNAFRFSHQPMAPELLDACDRLGMVVMDENRKLGDSPEILSQVESLVRRDRNHPCVIMWSMCNEEPMQGTEWGARAFSAMKDVVHKWDKTRPVTAAMNGGYGSGITTVTDLQGFNYNPGAYDDMHRRFPNLPMYGSETASEVSTRGIYANDKEKGYVSAYSVNFPSWAQTSEVAWRALAEREFMAGGYVWTGFDYRGEPTPYQWPVINSHFGILDTCGFPKDSFYYYKSWWGKEPVAHILPHWNWPGKEGQEIPVWVHGNAAKYELFLNGKSLGIKEMPRNSHLEWKVAYAPGTLETRGYDAGGKLIVSDKVETTGAPAKIALMPDRTQILGDNEDVSIVRVAILDAQNRVVPTADNEVTFNVEGAATVDGVGNGNASSHEPDKADKRHAFNGYCLIVLQNNGTSGGITLTASSPGLQSATVKLSAIKVPTSGLETLPRATGRLDVGLPGYMDYVHPGR